MAGFLRETADDMTAWLRRYDASNAEVWTYQHEGALAGFDNLVEVAEDAAGHVFAVGWEATAAEGRNGWIVKLTPDADEIWTHSFDLAGFDDHFFALALDASGDPVVVGSAQPTAGDDTALIAKFAR